MQICEFGEMDQKRWVTVHGARFSWYRNDFLSGMSPVHIIFCLQETEQHFIPVEVIPGWAHSSFQWPFSNEIIVLVQRQVIQAHEWESLCNNNYYKGSYGDLSNHYLGVKNSNKDTSEFLTCVFV